MSATRLHHLLSRIHDPEIGLIRHIVEIPIQPSEPDVFIAVADVQDPTRLHPRNLAPGNSTTATQGSGAALDRLGALWATVGEALERYAVQVYDPDSIVYARALDLDGPVLLPSSLILFAPEQYAAPDFPFASFAPDRPIGWVQGVDLGFEQPAWIPASLTYIGYHHRDRHEYFDSGYSTGTAAGPDFASAVLSGLLEVIERDAFALHWYLRKTPLRVDVNGLSARISPELMNILERSAINLDFRNITTDLGVPVVLAIARASGSGGLAIGAAARFSPAAALEKAAIEAFHTYNWILDMRRNGVGPTAPHEIAGYKDHVRHYLDPAMICKAEFLMSFAPSDLIQPFAGGNQSDSKSSLRNLVLHLKQFGLDCYAVDLTPPELDGLGIFIARTFITGLHPLGCGHGRQHLDDRRIRQFLTNVGSTLPDALNLDPHPFP
ncbi:YcaO-like family protein [Rhodocista pekingensis]|uniref:YcaO-like family protein n=1 Tax=Rhodocista pekingensis TaxID=201185 RepID=A0ABW2KSS5_9PROT